MSGRNASERFILMLKAAAERSLWRIDRFVRDRPGEDLPLITTEQIARFAGLVRRNGRIDDNQTFQMLALSGCRASVCRRYGQRAYDARDVLEHLARWTGSWAYVDTEQAL